MPRNSSYEPGSRSGAWRKMRINQGQEFVIGGYTLGGKNFDAVICSLFRERPARVRRKNALWFHAAVEEPALQSVPRAGDRGVSIREPPRGQKRTVEAGSYP